MINLNNYTKKELIQKINDVEKFPLENPNPVFRISKDRYIIFANNKALEIFNKFGLDIGEFVLEKKMPLIDKVLNDNLSNNIEFQIDDQIFRFNFRILDRYINFYGYDITDSIRVQKNFEKYVQIVERYVDISSTDLQGIITYASESFCNKTGYSKKELIGQNHNILRHPDIPNTIFEHLWQTIKNGKTWKGEVKNLTKSGSDYWAEVTITQLYDERNEHIGYTAIRNDITYRKKVEELSITDALTGLFNRRKFNEVLEQEISRARRDNKRICLAILDIDNFKKYNDNYGHPQGDIALKLIGKTLKNLFRRANEFAFRIGGEEFAILFYADNEKNVRIKIAEICSGIYDLDIPHLQNGIFKKLTVSVGAVSVIPDKNCKSTKLYKTADNLLYKVKEESKNNFKLEYL